MNNEKEFILPGIPDEEFLRDKVPMTKEEIRVITLSKLRLAKRDLVYDIGAGTGSIAIESSLIVKGAKVYAIEKNPVAVDLIKRNKEKFKCDNLEVIQGSAPGVLLDLPQPDKVIVGGSGGNLSEILEVIDDKLKVGGRIVINAIVLETLNTAISFFKDQNQKQQKYKLEIVQLSVAKAEPIAGLNMMKGYNPIFIITAEKNY